MQSRRFRILLAAFLLLALPSHAKGPLRAIDALMSRGRIAAAGRIADVPDPLHSDAGRLEIDLAKGSLSASSDYDFISYLLDSGLEQDALALMCSNLYSPSDSLEFLRGRTFYNTSHFADAADCFRSVSVSSPLSEKAFFYGNMASARSGALPKAVSLLRSYSGPNSSLCAVQKAGFDLLDWDFEAYDIDAALISDGHYAIREAASLLASDAERMRSFKGRSPFVGGLMSAVIPGAGKVYVGRIGEGVMSMLTVGAFGAMCAENWKHCSPSDWKTVLFGSLGAICYVANIYGGAVAVRTYNSSVRHGYETGVIVDITLPLGDILR